LRERLYIFGLILAAGGLLILGLDEYPSSVILNWSLAFGATTAVAVLVVSLYRVQQELQQSRHELSVKEAEIRFAREVQEALFPRSLPENSGLEFSAICRPAQGISGDYYDILETRNSRIIFALADVSGKGISAAITMANVQALLRTHAQTTDSLQEVCSRLNNHLYDFTESSRFATCFIAQWFPQNRRLEYVNAGHLAPVLDGFREEPDFLVGGPPLGMFQGIEYKCGHVELKPDDVLMVYSDGLSEAENERNIAFGVERIREIVALYRDRTPLEIQSKILDNVRKWRPQEPEDDITILVVKVKDPGSGRNNSGSDR